MLALSMVTLGVADVAAATAFYEAFGLKKSSASEEAVTFFQLGSGVLGLFGREPLKDDARSEGVWSGNGGMTLAYNVQSEADVDRIIAHAQKIGATVLKQPQKVFWGGYHGYFADPDGHVWEVAYNPFFPVDDRGAVSLP
jgi:uncharacterized glyoxalase superfamily protein PhnB